MIPEAYLVHNLRISHALGSLVVGHQLMCAFLKKMDFLQNYNK